MGGFGLRCRQLLVWLHVVSSVGWMSQAVALAVLTAVSLTAEPAAAFALTSAAAVLDSTALVFSANASAMTGFLLAATSTWGFFQHWWVTTKFVITFTQLYLGIFVLSASMPAVVTAAETGTTGPAGLVAAGAVLMACALGFQAWLSVAKPGGKTPAGRRAVARPTGAPVPIVAAAVVAVIVDVPLGVAMIPLIDKPAPVLTVVVLLVAIVSRVRQLRRDAAARVAAPGAAGSTRMEVTVARSKLVTPEVMALHLVPVTPATVSPWEPGAHIDLCLPSGLIRQYSLYGSPVDGGYQVAVLLERDGRGASRQIHALQPGDRLSVQGPRNHFALQPAPAYLFVAGGIGIVPLMPMIEKVAGSGVPWSLLYRGRTSDHLPFGDDLRHRYGDRVHLSRGDRDPRPDLTVWLRDQPNGVGVYCCGPDRLMASLEQAVQDTRPDATLHLERFTATDRSAMSNQPFEIELAYTQRTIPVPVGTSTLDALRAALPELPASCETGLCGSCRMTVIAGRPDHRDDILHGPDRSRTDVIYPCVSRSHDPRLVVDA